MEKGKPEQPQVVIIAIIIIVLTVVMAYPYTRREFTSPLDITFTSLVYLPAVLRNHRSVPDARFGIAEHTPTEAALLGLADARFIAGHWRLPLDGDTAIFLHPTERTHWSNWLLCSWSVADDWWHDEAGCRAWIREHPGMVYIIGNELGAPADLGGDGDWIDTTQYARWYHEAWALIKDEDPTAIVAPYGPVGQIAAGLLIDVWNSHLSQFGSRLQADFYPIHHYCNPNDGPTWCWTKLTHWIGWLEAHRGTHWVGPRDYWLLEWGLPAWSDPIPIEASLELMAGMTPRLQANTIGISIHAWWPSCLEWPHCTLLVKGGRPTALGERYLELALQ